MRCPGEAASRTASEDIITLNSSCSRTIPPPAAAPASRPLSSPVAGKWLHHQLRRLNVPDHQVDAMRVGLRSLTSTSASTRVTYNNRCSNAYSTCCATKPEVLPVETPSSDMLVNSFGTFHNYLRICLTEHCNLRCQYCMPAEGVELTPKSELLSHDEIIRVANLFVTSGVDKIRLTSGEPTVRKDLEDICLHLSGLKVLKTLAMTTNGIVLSKELPRVKEYGLNALNISLDTLIPAKQRKSTEESSL